MRIHTPKYLDEGEQNVKTRFERIIKNSWYTYMKGDTIEEVWFIPNKIYNNLKGTIVGIEDGETSVRFHIEVDRAFNELDVEDAAFVLEKPRNKGKSVVSFSVRRFKNSDDDDRDTLSIVPFQIAYAVSIHKAQGLEYESVKIVITDEVEELISHNIFYTAITRAKSKLKIYWTERAQRYILDEMHPMYNKQDASIIASKYKLKMYN